MFPNVKLSFMGDFVTIDNINFIGQFSYSKNKQYMIAWADANLNGDMIGHRDSGNGRIVILQNDKILLIDDKIQRPNDCKISNSGIYIVNDWLFTSDLQGIFYVKDIKGNIVFSYRLHANLLNNGIDSNGNFCVFCSLDSDHEDGDKLFIINIKDASIINKFRPQVSRADSYEINSKEKTVSLIISNDRIKYSFEGYCLEEERLDDFLNLYDLFNRAESEYGEKAACEDEVIIKKLINKYEKVINKNVSVNKKATSYRKIGELFLVLDGKKSVLKYFLKAVDLNPKLALKKKIDKLRNDEIK
ncbi:MAG TPA: hypothetical protein VF399_08215 [bacterium]